MWTTLRKHTWLITFFVIVGGVLGFGASRLVTPVYTSNATIYVTVSGAKSAADVSQTGTYLTSRMKSYVSLATSAAVMKEALTQLQGSETFNRLLTPKQRASSGDQLNAAAMSLQQEVSVANDADTTVLTVSVKGPQPGDAQRLTNAVSDALASQIVSTEKGVNDFAPIRASVINGAEVPTAPSSPKPYLNAVLGAGVGFALAAALSVLLATRPARTPRRNSRDRRDRRERRAPDTRRPSDRGGRPRRTPSATDDRRRDDQSYVARSASPDPGRA